MCLKTGAGNSPLQSLSIPPAMPAALILDSESYYSEFRPIRSSAFLLSGFTAGLSFRGELFIPEDFLSFPQVWPNP